MPSIRASPKKYICYEVLHKIPRLLELYVGGRQYTCITGKGNEVGSPHNKK